MNSKVRKMIHGQAVVAHPVFKGQPTPAYWLGAINEHTLNQRFPSAREVFRFASHLQDIPRHT